MKIIRVTLLAFLLTTIFFESHAQSDVKSYSFKKGEVFDIIFLSNKEGVEDKLKAYFSTAFPIATKMGYAGLGGFPIIESPLQGNYHPQSMVFGKWTNLENREKFVENIDEEMPTFHQMRRDIWSTFNLVYYKLKEDLFFEIDPNKYNVVTYYWKNDNRSFQQFKKEWLQKTENAGGKITLELTDGTSPFGYTYDPDYLAITTWESKEIFEKFYKENLKMNHSSIIQANQFKIK